MIFILFVLNSSFAMASSLQIQFEGLNELLLKGNAKLAASEAMLKASDDRKGSLARSFFPSLEVYGGSETFKVGENSNQTQPDYGAELQMNLYNGGKDQLESNKRKLNHQKLTFQNQRVHSEELLKARILYWEILYHQDLLKLTQTTKVFSEENKKQALRRIQSGVATNSDRFEFEMQEVEIQQQIAETELQLYKLYKEFKVLMNLDLKTEIQFPDNRNHDHDLSALKKHTTQEHEFLFKEAELESQSKKLSSQILKRDLWPKVKAYAAYNQFNEREEEFPRAKDRVESVIGLRMTLSLPSVLESRSEARALESESLAYQALANDQKRSLEVHFENEIKELELLHSQVHEAEENIQRAEKYYKLTQVEYSRGAKNSPDVLGASEKYFEVKNKHLKILKDFQISKSHVLSKVGR